MKGFAEQSRTLHRRQRRCDSEHSHIQHVDKQLHLCGGVVGGEVVLPILGSLSEGAPRAL